MRIVSLVPSVTETMLAWGVEPIACTRFCEQPDLLHVGGTKDPDVPGIVALAPDLVVVNDEENRLEDADALTAAGIAVHVVSIKTVDDVEPAMRDLARAVSATRFTAEPIPAGDPPPQLTAFVPIWKRPWMTMSGDTYGSSVLARLGVGNVFGEEAERYPTTDLDAAAARHPDVVLAPSEPYPFKQRHVAELERVAPVVLIDGQDLFWWGARTPAALTRLASALRAVP